MTHKAIVDAVCLKCGATALVEDMSRRLWDCAACGATHEDRYWNGRLMLRACETCGTSLRDVVAMQHVVHDPNANPQSRVVKTCPGCHPVKPDAEHYTCITCGKDPSQVRTVFEHWQATAVDGARTPVVTCGGVECRRTGAEFGEMLEAKRPLQVGDYVRWISPIKNLPFDGAWADAEVIDMGSLIGDQVVCTLKIYAIGPGWTASVAKWTSRRLDVGDTTWTGVGDLKHIGRPPERQPELVDGLTRRQCLELYEQWQRGDSYRWRPGERMTWGMFRAERMTPAQIAAAREQWSAQLRAKVAKTSKPRLTVLCDSGEADE